MSQAMNSESVPSNGISDQNGDSTPQENASGKAHGHLTKENYTSDTSPVNDMGTATDYGSYKEPLPKRTPPRGAHEPAANYLKRKWLPEIERATMQEWRTTDWYEMQSPSPIIQAFYLQLPDSRQKSQTDSNPLDTDDADTTKNLQRIVISSEYIYDELTSLTTTTFTTQDVIAIGPPYKILTHAFPRIRERLPQLKQEMDDAKLRLASSTSTQDRSSSISEEHALSPNRTSSPTSPPPVHGPGIKSKAVDSDEDRAHLAEARYIHLKILHDLIVDELGEVLGLIDRIKKGIQETICFEDLWHLFKPGDIVYSKENGYDQLYRVFFVTGGQTLKRYRTRDEVVDIQSTQNKIRYYIPPEMHEDDEEETINKMLREEGSGLGTWTPLRVDCYLMGFDGEDCGPAAMTKKISSYIGDRKINTLSVFPLKFHPKKDELLRAMESRGRKFLFAGGHKSYDGKTLAMKRNESRIEIQSDIYVDFDTFYQGFPLKKPMIGKMLRSKQNFAEEEEIIGGTRCILLCGHEVDSKLSNQYLLANRRMLEKFKPEEGQVVGDTLLLMPHYVIGYAFQVRQWFYLDIELVREIDRESAEARTAGFEDLVISQRYRDLLIALVDNHASGLQRGIQKSKAASIAKKPTQIDLVRGKGQGLIILLHGPPGSGKTSTAETIAAYTRRPLYSITCGDLGTNPADVERNLLDHTRRADKWGCVLLLDEADVFLVQRDWSNLLRNALTSIFLRQLEYYAGILFLTTNRPGVIDEAFKSRIHISLRYPNIDLESTKKMWNNIMNRLERENKHAEIKVLFDKEALREFAQRHYEKCARDGVTWNGRQIRNAFQTALALGHHERTAKIREAGMTPDEALATGKKKWRTVRLTKANFSNIAKTAKEFEQYIETLRGSDSQNARESELRYDEWDPERPMARKQYPASGTMRESVNQFRSSVEASRTNGKGKGKKAAKVEEPPSSDEEEEEEEEEEKEDSEESEDISEDEDEF